MLPKQYADAISPRLSPELFQPVPSRALWLPVHATIIAAGTFAIANAHVGVLLRFGISVVVAFSFACIAILGHEVLHGSVVEPLWQRRILGTLCLAPVGIGPVFWMIWHNLHHANPQHPLRDPDTWGMLDHIPHDRAMGWLRRFANPRTLAFPFLLATGVTGHAAALLFCFQKQMLPKQRAATLIEFIALWLFWVGLGLWLGWANWLFFFVVPLLVANVIVNAFVVTNHFLCPLDETGDPLATSLTVITKPWIERALLNFNYHTEHHLFPRMSPKYAPRVAQLLQEMWPDRYHHLPFLGAFLAVWRTPRVYYDSLRLVDTRTRTLYGTLGHHLKPGSAGANDMSGVS